MDAGVVHLTGLWRQLARLAGQHGADLTLRPLHPLRPVVLPGHTGSQEVTGGHMGSLRVRSQQDGAAEFTRAASVRICRFDRGRPQQMTENRL